MYPATVINWIKDGLLPAYTTPGGHRRIKKNDILQLMKKNNMPIPTELSQSDKFRVLIIDDDPKILKMISMIVSGEDYLEVVTAESGFHAGMVVSSTTPDIILLDFLMPDMDGFEVCRRLRADERTKDIPIIAVTVLKNPDELNKMKAAGITDHVAKPFKSDDIIAMVKKHLHFESANG